MESLSTVTESVGMTTVVGGPCVSGWSCRCTLRLAMRHCDVTCLLRLTEYALYHVSHCACGGDQDQLSDTFTEVLRMLTSASTGMGNHQGKLSAVNVGPLAFVGVDLNR